MKPKGERLLGFAALFLLLGFFAIAWPAADECSRNQNCHGYRQTNSDRPAQKPEETLWDRTARDPVALYTLVLAVFTAVLAGASILQGYFLIRADRTAREAAEAALKTAIAIGVQNNQIERSIQEAGRAADAMIKANELSQTNIAYSQRAWLRPRVTVTGITYGAGIRQPIVFYFKITIENIGKAPATNVYCGLRLVVYQYVRGETVDSVEIIQARLGEDSKINERRDLFTHESVVFPGDTIEIVTGETVSKERYDEIMKTIEAFRNQKDADEVDLVLGPPDAIDPMLIGCIDYRIPFSDKHHQTWFAHHFVMASGKTITISDFTRDRMEGRNFAVRESWAARQHAD